MRLPSDRAASIAVAKIEYISETILLTDKRLNLTLVKSGGTFVNQPIEQQWDIIGRNIKKHRTRQRLSLRALAAKCNASASFLSQLERGACGAHLATLLQISAALHVSLSELMSDAQTGEVRFVPAQSRESIDDDDDHQKTLITKKSYGGFEVFIHSISPGAATAEVPYTHGNAQECLFVLKGKVEVLVGSQTFRMQTGDALEYRSDMQHLATNIGTEFAALMFIVGPDEGPPIK